VDRDTWYVKKYVQTMDGPVFVAGKSNKCVNPDCTHKDEYYYARGVLLISLPYSTYGLDVLAFIGWQHEHEHRQLVEIQKQLNQRGILINERTVGKQYRQFLALLGGMSDKKRERLAEVEQKHDGLIWAIDALQPEGCGSSLYVLYEVLSGTPVSAIQLENPTTPRLTEWLAPYKELPFNVLATLSDGEKAIVAALKGCWKDAPHQRCQLHFLNRVAEPVMEEDSRLRRQLRGELGGLAPVPTHTQEVQKSTEESLPDASPFCL
jgi:alpha-L-fucosidase